MPLALSTGHQVGLAVTAGVFIAFALASSFLFPRFRPNYPAGGLPAFIVVSFLFFFGMLAAVEVFGVEEETHESERAAETLTEAEPRVPPTTTAAQPTTTAPTTTQATTTQQTTTTEAKATTVKVTETEFKIALPSTRLAAGKITFDVQNAGNIPHDLAIKGMKEQTKLIPAGGSAKLTVTLKPGTYGLWCTVPGHEAAGMKLDITVS